MSSAPIRCFTCGKLLSFDIYNQNCQNLEKNKALDKMKISRQCCRRMYLTHVENVYEEYYIPPDRIYRDVKKDN